MDNVVQNNDQVEEDSIDSDIGTVEDSNQVKATEATFTVGATALMVAGWGTNITGDLLFTVLDDVPNTVSVAAVDGSTFMATNFSIQGHISNAGITYNITKIGDDAFRNCSGLINTLTISGEATYIGDSAFYGCSGLTGALTIPASVTYIGINTFYDCNFVSIGVDSNIKNFSEAENLKPCQAIIDNTSGNFGASSKVVGSLACGELVLPSDIKTIADDAFFTAQG